MLASPQLLFVDTLGLLLTDAVYGFSDIVGSLLALRGHLLSGLVDNRESIGLHHFVVTAFLQPFIPSLFIFV